VEHTLGKDATRAILRIILPYVAFAGLWILLSDWILAGLHLDPATQTHWSIYKGWAFYIHHGMLDEGIHFLQKPFSLRDVALKVRQTHDEE
jgi:hypothetical protein